MLTNENNPDPLSIKPPYFDPERKNTPDLIHDALQYLAKVLSVLLYDDIKKALSVKWIIEIFFYLHHM